jgi:hypothetical protein
VGARLLYCMGRTFQGRSSILVEEMFMWWKEFRQITYLDVIKWDLWFTSPKMLDRRYIQFYRISSFAFENLVQQIMPFIMRSLIFVRDS